MHALIFANLVLFLSTLSLRRATLFFGRDASKPRISIHALLAESDKSVINGIMERDNFYPRSPCGERPLLKSSLLQSQFISIHALLAESDTSPIPAVTRVANFYPRSPCGERLLSAYVRVTQRQRISIHALLAESDLIILCSISAPCISIHALLAESDTTAGVLILYPLISIHALLAESDLSLNIMPSGRCHFYPRSPCGERHAPNRSPYLHNNFYPRSPCGERR